MAVVHAVERFIFGSEDARRLAALRIGLFGLLALRIATNGGYGDVAGQPEALFDPVSLFHLLDAMPSPELALAAQISTVVAALAAAAGLWPRLTFPAAWTGALFLGLMLNATGKIVHNDVVLMLCLLPLLATPRVASAAWSVGRAEAGRARAGEAYGWPIRTAMVIVALAYLFVGLQKLRFSGIDWVTSENLRWVLYASSDSQADPNQVALFVADHGWLAHLFAAGTIVVEVGFILCLPIAPLRWFFVPAAVSLHLGIWLAMDLDYSAQAATVVIVFVNWAALPRANLTCLTARTHPKPWAWWSLRGIAVLGVAGLLTFALAFAARGWGTDRTHVPYVVGTSERVAVARVERHGLEPEVIHDRRARRTLSHEYAGQVVYQTWNRGVQLPRGSTLRLTVYPADRR